ncbi:MAG TPA: PepSY domain-containing protein [Anaerolineae bacterium]|nr:PepSY domain-containing protein [Anaerolineae bacterium]
MQVNKKLAVGAAALLLAGSLGVTAINAFAQTTQPTAQGQLGTAQEQLGTPGITFGQAAAAAEAHLNDGSASEVELENKTGQLIYTVEIGASEVRVDAMSGEVLGVDSDQKECDDEKDAASLGTPAITFDQAQAAAEAHLNAGSASEIELENENGQLVYSVEIGASEVKLDAMTGAVLGVERD